MLNESQLLPAAIEAQMSGNGEVFAKSHPERVTHGVSKGKPYLNLNLAVGISLAELNSGDYQFMPELNYHGPEPHYQYWNDTIEVICGGVDDASINKFCIRRIK